jgi:transposase-like protein
VTAPDLFEPKLSPHRKARAAFLVANPDVAVAILAEALGITERTVLNLQRKLHLIPLSKNCKYPLHHAPVKKRTGGAI